MRSLAVAAVLISAGAASGQTALYAVTFNGALYRLNTTTGVATLIGATGYDRLNAAAMNCDGEVYATRLRNTTVPSDSNQLIKISVASGFSERIWSWGTANDFRGLAFADDGLLYALRDNSIADSLCRIELDTGAVQEIGLTGRTDLQGLGAAPGGKLLAVGSTPAGAVYDIDMDTGLATLLGGTGGDDQAVEFAVDSLAWVARGNLATVNLITGATVILGSTGVTEIRGLAGFRPWCSALACYANCDHSSGTPILTGNDFQCFLDAFASGQTAANCDASTGFPVLTANDFQCFLNAYAAGCP